MTFEHVEFRVSNYWCLGGLVVPQPDRMRVIGYEVQSLVTSGDVQAEVLLFREQGAVIDRVEGRTEVQLRVHVL